MRQKHKRLAAGISALTLASLVACTSFFGQTPPILHKKPATAPYAEGKFRNTSPSRELNFMTTVKAFWYSYTQKDADSVPSGALDIVRFSRDDLLQAPDSSLWRLGHSTVLLKLEGKFWLTDPVFAERASPFSFAGPKRFHAPPIAREDLPEIEAVILSHDHYDHLDQETVLALEPKVKRYLTPLGVGDRLLDWGIAADKVTQLDWWDELQIGSLTWIATPARHFSGRSLWDRNSTLWSSWVAITPTTRLFFSGDSGYFEGFKMIGERFGPFDLTLIENGAYNQAWADIHMQPEQTVQTHLDLGGKHLLPIHNGTFDLSLHAWTEPLERIRQITGERGISLSTPRFGERVDIRHPASGEAWWKKGPERK